MSTTEKLKSTLPAVANGKSKDPLVAMMDSLKPQLALALPKHLTADRMARIALTTLRTTPALAKCAPASIMACCLKSAQLGLEFGLLGHAYMVPYGTEAQFIIGFKGFVDLMYRTGLYKVIDGEVIHRNDKFIWRKGYDDTLEHIPNFDNPGPVIGVYAFYVLLNGGRRAVVMSTADVEKIRARSKCGKSGPWVSDWDEMAKKTVVRRLAKMAPMSVEIRDQIAEDEQLEFGGAESIEVNASPTPVAEEPALELAATPSYGPDSAPPFGTPEFEEWQGKNGGQ